MKRSWPKVTASIRFDFHAEHSMTRLGKECAVPHRHQYSVHFGWTHEIQPMSGFTHEFAKQRREFQLLIDRVAGKYLNDILPMQPSAEVLALWLLAHTEPAYCDNVVIETYGGYTVRVDRELQRSEWMGFMRGGPDPYSNHIFTVK